MIILSQQEAETIYSFLCDLRAEGDMMRNEKLPGTISWLRVRIDNSLAEGRSDANAVKGEC